MDDRTQTPVRIGILGDFDRAKHSHWATEAALFHAAARLDLRIEPHWVATPPLAAEGAAQRLADFSGLWAAPGNCTSSAGMLRGIRYARERDVPLLGTCAGFQHALIEFTRNVLGVVDADSAEAAPNAANVVITPVACPTPGRAPGAPQLAGPDVARPVAGSLLERLCGGDDLRGEYFCSYETNAAFVHRWQAAGLRVAARGGEGEMRAFELPQQRFFMATLFQPQLSSSFGRPHPIIEGYLRACMQLEHTVVPSLVGEVDGL
jgi:CTP synthase (UTP-ammonia lyase)